MNDTVQTMQIETENGPVTINESDFDKETMTPFKEQTQSDVLKMDADALFAESLANIDGMKKEALIVALEAMEADTEGKVPDLKERLRTVMTDAYNAE